MNEQGADIKQRLQLAVKKGNKREQQKLWHQYSQQQGFSNEWIIAARLGEPAYTEEQVHMVDCLFGR